MFVFVHLTTLYQLRTVYVIKRSVSGWVSELGVEWRGMGLHIWRTSGETTRVWRNYWTRNVTPAFDSTKQEGLTTTNRSSFLCHCFGCITWWTAQAAAVLLSYGCVLLHSQFEGYSLLRLERQRGINTNCSSRLQSANAVLLQSQFASVCTAYNLVPCVRWSSAYPISPKVETKR
jgi:hypothetical protein